MNDYTDADNRDFFEGLSEEEMAEYRARKRGNHDV